MYESKHYVFDCVCSVVTCPRYVLLVVVRMVFVIFLVDHSQEAVEYYEQSQNQAPNEFAAVIPNCNGRRKSLNYILLHSNFFKGFRGKIGVQSQIEHAKSVEMRTEISMDMTLHKTSLVAYGQYGTIGYHDMVYI